MKIENWKLEIAKRKGFTLIEMLVVVFVIGIGLIGAMSFFNINLNNQFEAKNELIAAGLAQEGLELVRNIRDYNILSGEKWYKLDLLGETILCQRIDYRSLDKSWLWGIYFHKCLGPLISSDKVCLDNATRRYRQCSNSESANTDFKRSISITRNGDLDAGGYLEVTCTVTWNNRTTVAKDILYANQF